MQTYELAPGERATSILDWEARHMKRVSEANGLKVVNISTKVGAGEGWYPIKLSEWE